jgi:hypothetical protein
MVHVDHAYGTGARMVMEATAEVVRATAESLEQFRAFTQGPNSSPDAEVAEAVADRFDGLAATLRTVHDEIVEELELLPRHSTRPGTSGA